MSSDRFEVTFWGVRGSIPTPGPTTVHFGGNTICVEVICGDHRLIVDSGSGLRVLGKHLLSQMPVRATMFFTHFHWDHIQGFPFFTPAFIPGNHFDIYGESKLNSNVNKVLQGQMMDPNFPVSLEDMNAEMRFHHISPGDRFDLEGGIHVRTASLRHPGSAISYRIEYGGRVLVTGWDTEHPAEGVDATLLEQAKDADVLIYDATYDDDDYFGRLGGPPKIGWGHSTWQRGLELVEAANVERVFFIHHDPLYDDARLHAIERAAREQNPSATVAVEGTTISL
ncbi:MAG: MBL fold metallo-hydrolase [Myxococcales bacterium]|nr:MBL fold metallo-hydrolase [Myxococcales bacterium]